MWCGAAPRAKDFDARSGSERSHTGGRRGFRTRAPHRHFAAFRLQLGQSSRRARARRRGGDRRRAHAAAPRSLSRADRQRRRRDRPRARAGIRAALRAACARARRRNCCSAWRGSAATRARSGVAHAALGEAAARADVDARSSASISISSSGSGAASCCPTPPTISPASSTSVRWRGCAMISRRSASSASRATTSRRITPRPCARSWRRSPADASRRRKARSASCSRSTWRRGSAASSPISNAREAGDFYRHVGALGRVFIDIETEAFALPD